jgi:hypothetical protein
MRFCNGQRPFTGGIELHARTMHLCILDQAGNTALDRNLPCRPDAFLRALAPSATGCPATSGWSKGIGQGVPVITTTRREESSTGRLRALTSEAVLAVRWAIVLPASGQRALRPWHGQD